MKMISVNLERGQAKLIDRRTKEDKTAEILPKVRAKKEKRRRVEEIARECRLGTVYDHLYRFESLVAHGKSFDLPSPMPEASAQVSALNGILNAMILIVDNPCGSVQPRGVLAVLIGKPRG